MHFWLLSDLLSFCKLHAPFGSQTVVKSARRASSSVFLAERTQPSTSRLFILPHNYRNPPSSPSRWSRHESLKSTVSDSVGNIPTRFMQDGVCCCVAVLYNWEGTQPSLSLLSFRDPKIEVVSIT